MVELHGGEDDVVVLDEAWVSGEHLRESVLVANTRISFRWRRNAATAQMLDEMLTARSESAECLHRRRFPAVLDVDRRAELEQAIDCVGRSSEGQDGAAVG